MAILVLAEHDLGALSPAMGRLVAAAKARRSASRAVHTRRRAS